MTIESPAIPEPAKTAKFDNAAEWWHALGDVPLERIVMDPWPGNATEKDLLLFVERDKRLVELIDGTLVEKPMGWLESFIAMRLAIAMGNFVDARKLGVIAGEAGTLRMKSGRIRLPDLCFVSVDDLPNRKIPTESVPTLPPTLAVEILSASNTKREMEQKVKEYFDSGSKLVWLIDPVEKSVAVFEQASVKPARVLAEQEVLDGGIVLPGFSIALAELFAEPSL